MITGTLDNNNKVSPEFKFDKTASILLVGKGDVRIERKLDNGKYFPITTPDGRAMALVGVNDFDVIFNSEIENKCPIATYRLATEAAEGIHYQVFTKRKFT